MNIEHRYIVKLIKELEEKDAKIESMTQTGDNATVAELRQENLVLSQQVEHSTKKQVELQEIAEKLRVKNAEVNVENEKLKNENWELFRQKDNQDKVNNEKLQKELEKMESLVNKDSVHLSKKDKEISNLKEENEALNNRVNEMKEQLKVKNTPASEEEKAPVTQETYSTMDIFQKIKEGSLIKELKMVNGRGKGSRLSSHPFVFELGNCSAFFNETSPIACLEKRENVNTFIPIAMDTISQAVTSSMKEYIGINMDFKVAQHKDLKGHSTTIKKVLQCKQLINKEGYLCSHEQYTWYIYQENDGSKFIVLPNGDKEVV